MKQFYFAVIFNVKTSLYSYGKQATANAQNNMNNAFKEGFNMLLKS